MTERKTESKADYIEIKPGDWVVHLSTGFNWPADAREHFEQMLAGDWSNVRDMVAASRVVKVMPNTFVISGHKRVPREWVAAAFTTEAEARRVAGKIVEVIHQADHEASSEMYRIGAEIRLARFEQALEEGASLLPDLFGRAG